MLRVGGACVGLLDPVPISHSVLQPPHCQPVCLRPTLPPPPQAAIIGLIVASLFATVQVSPAGGRQVLALSSLAAQVRAELIALGIYAGCSALADASMAGNTHT